MRSEEVDVFRQRLEERFRKYGLELAEEKTKILEFGRFARRNRKARGERKPDTFDFLGFTFYCGMDRKKRFYRCRVKTSSKKFRSKIRAMKEWIKAIEQCHWSRYSKRSMQNCEDTTSIMG